MKVINDKKRLLFTLKEKTSGPLVVSPEELLLVEESLNQTPGGVAQLKGYTVSALPIAVQGDMAYVTDATAP